jgi:ATP-dependent RNA helicase SUPV3L1/SUV3
MAPPLHSTEPIQLAQLGPTNTGKTHRAVRRMLAHRTGMIGLPLRLLAREIYERVVAEVGAADVALVTGEERCIPERPRYWICTVESMPVNRSVEFLAVDEIQLATHPERGHVFTGRLMHASGTHETWFLGSDSMAPIVRQLAPTARIETHQRFSKLRHTGSSRLSSLPPRSAVVAFSMREVYEMAERLRRHRGGTAVVMGALSPRARNAQVEMYQAGEVDFMVATDAIGMGLNMDISHVAFSGLHKFDGKQTRALAPGELAQIAGRAGRFKRDGSFGTLSGVEAIDPRVVEAIENHRFRPVDRVRWRSSSLDFSSPDSLLESLRHRPSHRCLISQQQAVDESTLVRLLENDDVRIRARGEQLTRLLWEVCQVPDFRKTLVDSHVQLLTEIYLQLTGDEGCLSPDWIAPRMARLDREEGGIETLTTRIAFVRTWTYIAHRSRWVKDPSHWYGRARAIEDRLSDALHTRLTHRFVDRKTLALVRGLESLKAGSNVDRQLSDDGQVLLAGQSLGSIKGLDFHAEQSASTQHRSALWKAARLALADEVEERITQLFDDPDEHLSLDATGQLLWEKEPLGRLVCGSDLFHPDLRLTDLALVDSHARQRLYERLLHWVRDQIAKVFPQLDTPDLSHEARGLLYQLRQGMGCIPVGPVRSQIKAIGKPEKKRLSKMGIRFGVHFIYVEQLLTDEALVLRSGLWKARSGHQAQLALPIAPSTGCTDRSLIPWYKAIGYVPTGPRALRVDRYETARAQLRGLARAGEFQASEALKETLQCEGETLRAVVESMGYRANGDEHFIATRKPTRRRKRGRSRVHQPQW